MRGTFGLNATVWNLLKFFLIWNCECFNLPRLIFFFLILAQKSSALPNTIISISDKHGEQEWSLVHLLFALESKDNGILFDCYRFQILFFKIFTVILQVNFFLKSDNCITWNSILLEWHSWKSTWSVVSLYNFFYLNQ